MAEKCEEETKENVVLQRATLLWWVV